MLKRLSFIIIIVSGMFLFLLGCTKDGQDTLAFIGDEKDMKTCYEIYPEEYFPTVIDDQLRKGRFPPDIVGEYEMDADFVECTYEQCMENGQWIPISVMSPKSMCIIIEEQVNGMAKLKFSFKRNGSYKYWYEVDAYIYGDVYSENNYNDFIICYENVEKYDGLAYSYNRGNIIKGSITDNGLENIDYWSIIKNRDPESIGPMCYKEGGYEHYHADFATRQNN